MAPAKARTDGDLPATMDAVAANGATTWHLRMPEGPIYGPIGWEEVLAWTGEGRLAADCELAQSRSGPWRNVAELLPSLARKLPPASPVAAPEAYPWTSNAQGNATGGGYVAAHRGGLILVLGLLGWTGCPVLSFAAWIMGSHDLREMRAGRMERSGEAATLAGMIFGMIVSGLWILAGVVLAAILLIMALVR